MSPRTPEQNEEIRQQTHKQIMDAAFELFANDGFGQTSISMVAEKAGVSKGLIYHYFDSKEAILEAIFDQLVAVADEVLDFPEDFKPADKIRRILEKSFEFTEEQTSVGRLMISLVLQPEVFDSLKPKIVEMQDTQMVLYTKIMEELGYDEPELEAYQLGAMMDGMLLGVIAMGDNYPFEQLKQKILKEYVPDY